jgi:hypothetical protein
MLHHPHTQPTRPFICKTRETTTMGSTPPAIPRPPGGTPDAGSYGIPNSRAKVVKSVLSFIVVAAILLCCGGFINPRWVGWCLIAVGLICMILALAEGRKLFDGSPVLLLTAEGFCDNSRKPARIIPWNDIQKVTLWTLRVNGIPSTRTLILDV